MKASWSHPHTPSEAEATQGRRPPEKGSTRDEHCAADGEGEESSSAGASSHPPGPARAPRAKYAARGDAAPSSSPPAHPGAALSGGGGGSPDSQPRACSPHSSSPPASPPPPLPAEAPSSPAEEARAMRRERGRGGSARATRRVRGGGAARLPRALTGTARLKLAPPHRGQKATAGARAGTLAGFAARHNSGKQSREAAGLRLPVRQRQEDKHQVGGPSGAPPLQHQLPAAAAGRGWRAATERHE